MTTDELKKLAANPDFISGIYNYCDRWCERCPFSSRCFLYATESLESELDDPGVRDLNNAMFWRKLELIFTDARELIRECALEAGVDLDAIQANKTNTGPDRSPDYARRHQLSALARTYAGMVQTWFDHELRIEQSLDNGTVSDAKKDDAEIDIPAAVEVIRWYQFFIAAKVFRALLGSDNELDGVYGTQEEAAVNSAQTDSNGSAKIALIAVDRSCSAWQIMQGCIPREKDSIRPLVAVLESLRTGIEETNPLARDFVRPGFDEVISEFAS